MKSSLRGPKPTYFSRVCIQGDLTWNTVLTGEQKRQTL